MRSVLSCQGFLIYIGDTDDENASLCRHAFPDDLWIHLSERASPHALVSIGDLKLLSGQEDRYRRTPDGRKMLDLGLTIYEAALLVKFLSDSREDEESNAVYTRADSLLLNEANRSSGGSVYDILSGSTSHHDDEFSEMPGRVLLTRMPHFYRIEHDEHKALQLLARSERSGSMGNMDREYTAWKEIMLRREATNRREWYMRRSYGEQIFQDDSDDESDAENGEIANLHNMEQNGGDEHDDAHDDVHEDIDDMSVEQKDVSTSDSEEAHNCEANEKGTFHTKSEKENCGKAEPTEEVDVQKVKEIKPYQSELSEDCRTDGSKRELTTVTGSEKKDAGPNLDRKGHVDNENEKQKANITANDVSCLESNKESTIGVLQDGLAYNNKSDQKNIKRPPSLNVVPEKRPNQDQSEKRRNVVRAVEKKTNEDQTDKGKSASQVMERRVPDGTETKAS
ncbi:hypothetical protein FGB62_48g048 [Gracilaria domingensis]|nr:hypothetical protein FGB62_48g048 [Gracilaria domingensis]